MSANKPVSCSRCGKPLPRDIETQAIRKVIAKTPKTASDDKWLKDFTDTRCCCKTAEEWDFSEEQKSLLRSQQSLSDKQVERIEEEERRLGGADIGTPQIQIIQQDIDEDSNQTPQSLRGGGLARAEDKAIDRLAYGGKAPTQMQPKPGYSLTKEKDHERMQLELDVSRLLRKGRTQRQVAFELKISQQLVSEIARKHARKPPEN